MLYRPGTGILRGITSMRLCICLPTHFNEPDEVWMGESKLAGLAGESREPETVFIRDGLIALAFRPLELTDYGRPCAVRLARAERFLTISFMNYEGPERSLNFPHMSALYTQNGFAFEAEAIANDEEFSAFRKRVLQAELTDRIDAGIRTAAYKRNGLELRIAHDPFNEGDIPPAWINGQPRETPRFRSTTVAKLPW